ncbi:MAG: hypothetical protein L0Z53_18530 [Acidobacteriales bacterium]|nr:hypothetical protein [Terriglobales bacterium]
MQPLLTDDTRHLEAAQGWLDLGNWQEANEELEKITPTLRAHPDILELRCRIYAAAKRWQECEDWLARALDVGGMDWKRKALDDPLLKDFWQQAGGKSG